MQKLCLLLGALSAGLSVVIGAFGAHSLKKILEANQQLENFETAVRYQFYHSLALLIMGVLMTLYPIKAFQYAGYAFGIGILIFSGSLYILTLSGMKWLGMITPIGGLAMIIGWGLVAWGVLQIKY